MRSFSAKNESVFVYSSFENIIFPGTNYFVMFAQPGPESLAFKSVERFCKI